MVDSNGVQDAKEVEEEVEFPQTWEALVADTPILAGLPGLKSAETWSFDDSARFEKEYTRMGVAYGDTISNDDTSRMVEMVEQRTEALRGMIAFLKSISAEPDKVDEFTRGIGLGDLFILMMEVGKFYNDQLGKSVRSRNFSAATE